MEKEPSFVVLCSVFFCQVRQKALRAYGPTAVSPSAVLVPRKLGIHIHPPDCTKQVKTLHSTLEGLPPNTGV